jgi:hypothetical protein
MGALALFFFGWQCVGAIFTARLAEELNLKLKLDLAARKQPEAEAEAATGGENRQRQRQAVEESLRYFFICK